MRARRSRARRRSGAHVQSGRRPGAPSRAISQQVTPGARLPGRQARADGRTARRSQRTRAAGLTTHSGQMHADRRLDLALRADRAPAPLAEHLARAVRMPVADSRRRLRRRRSPSVGRYLVDDVDGLDDDRLERHVAAVGGDGLDRVDDALRLARRPPRRRSCACPAATASARCVMKNCEPLVPWPPCRPAFAIASM